MLKFANIRAMIGRAVRADSSRLVEPFVGFAKLAIKKDDTPIHGFIKNEPIISILVNC